MSYKIRRNYNRNGPSMRNPFYLNAADLHLPRPKRKTTEKGMVDGYPIIHINLP